MTSETQMTPESRTTRSLPEIDNVLDARDGDLPESDIPPHTPLLEVRGLGKRYSGVTALAGITATVNSGEVTCVLGDNGAGKSTLIKILTGVVTHDSGQYFVGGKRVRFNTPRQALDRGIAAVYQDNVLVPTLSIWRNFFLGSEPTRGIWPFRRLDMAQAKETTVAELGRFGLEVRDPGQRVSSLSAGERQALAIARALYFGARVLILDEPTAALGVVQSGIVLRQITAARERGIGVVFITHNPRQAYPVGDRFLLLNHGAMVANVTREDVDLAGLTQLMAGGADLDELTHEV